MIVNSQNGNPDEKLDHNKTKTNSNIIHYHFPRSHGTIATIKAHNLWEDTYILQKAQILYVYHVRLCQYQHIQEKIETIRYKQTSQRDLD